MEIIKLLLVLGFIAIAIMVRYIHLTTKKARNRRQISAALSRRTLVLEAEPDNLVVKSKNSFEQQDREISQINIIDSLYNSRAGTEIQKFYTIIIYNGKIEDQTITFISPPLNFDEVNIRFKLLNASKVKIYINPQNYEDYHFDLAFLQ